MCSVRPHPVVSVTNTLASTFAVKYNEPKINTCTNDPMCIKSDVALLKNVRHGLIDPATPSSVMTRKSVNGKTLNLVVCRIVPQSRKPLTDCYQVLRRV